MNTFIKIKNKLLKTNQDDKSINSQIFDNDFIFIMIKKLL